MLVAYESEEIGVAALNTQIENMVASGSAEADVITGATITCNALNEAVSEALASSQK